MAELLTRGSAFVEGDVLAREIDGIAAVLEGFVARNSLGLHFECLAPNVTHVLRRALECGRAPTFPEKEVDEERRVALEDLAAEDDDSATIAFREALQKLYRAHPFGRRHRGTRESLKRLGSRRLCTLWSRGYPLGRAVLGICGDEDVDAVVGLCEALDAGGPRPPACLDVPGGEPRYPKRPIRHRIPQTREQTHFVLLWPGLWLDDPRVDVLDVLLAVMGGQAGRLFDALRERQGLVYHVAASSAEGLDAGHVDIYGATSPSNLEAALDAVARELDRLRAELCGPEELERAKAWIIGQYEVEMQRRSRVASQLAFDEALGMPLATFRSYPARLARVTAKSVRELCRVLLPGAPAVTTIVG